MNHVLAAYYGMIDDCKDSPAWVRKIEEDIGQSIAYLCTAFDESVRDKLVEKSPLFHRFVRLVIRDTSLILGLGKAKVLQVRSNNRSTWTLTEHLCVLLFKVNIITFNVL